MNVNDVERVVSVLLGTTLASLGLRRASSMRLLLLLGSALLLHRGLTGRCQGYAALGLSSIGARDGKVDPHRLAAPHAVVWQSALVIESAITVGLPVTDVFRAWKEPRTLARILADVAEIHRAESGELEWTLKQPFERAFRIRTRWVESNAPTELVWSSVPNDTLRLSGAVRFSSAPAKLGTQVKLRMEVSMPGGGALGWLLRPLEAVARAKTTKVLRHFKSLAETGEIPTLQGSPAARDQKVRQE